jgi:hypothetical protein
MYVRHASITVPGGINEARGYDLLGADWVPPYGKGHFSDFIVTITDMQYRSWNDHEASATVTFSNEGVVALDVIMQQPMDALSSKLPGQGR